VALAAVAGKFQRGDLRQWLLGGRRAAVQLRVGAEVLWVALGMAEEAAPAASSLAAVADGVGLRPEQGATAL
jgi:hypothetical protein